MTRISPAALAAVLSLSATGAIAQDAFNQRFSGQFSGTGTVLRPGEEQPRRVSCNVTGTGDEDSVGLDGTCRAAVIFSRAISADLRFDPRTNRYSGIYNGSKNGPAQLSGQRQGDTVRLAIAYRAPINGDRVAMMMLRSEGDRRFRITVVDKVGGRDRETTDITFERR